MASFKDLKARLQGKSIPPKVQKQNPYNQKIENLELEESRYLLALIAKSDFNGADIQIVYNVALKLQNIIKSYINTEENAQN